jgi:hypothetical protein
MNCSVCGVGGGGGVFVFVVSFDFGFVVSMHSPRADGHYIYWKS